MVRYKRELNVKLVPTYKLVSTYNFYIQTGFYIQHVNTTNNYIQTLRAKTFDVKQGKRLFNKQDKSL